MWLVALMIGCGGGAADSATETQQDARFDDATWPVEIGGEERPATVMFPSDYDGESLLPVVVLLHGYSANSVLQELYFQLSPLVDEYGFVYVLPDGTVDEGGSMFWNATPGCCDLYGSGVDDVSYLLSLLDEVEASFPVDLDRVYFSGHSNGGFMSYRMACEAADRIAGVASLAGATFMDESDCLATQPVSVLQIHGDADSVIRYEGDFYYPGAVETVERWAERASCDVAGPQTESVDLFSTEEGEETEVIVYPGCDAETDVRLWTVADGSHVPAFGETFSRSLLDWLLAQRR